MKRLFSLSGLFLFAAAIFFALNVNINAQHRDNESRDRNQDSRGHQVSRNHQNNRDGKDNRGYQVDRGNQTDRSHQDYRDIIVKDRHYFYREGHFYDRRPEGYVRIAPPIGARIPDLPPGYDVVMVRRHRYYVYDGIYYKYMPRERVYVVIEIPM